MPQLIIENSNYSSISMDDIDITSNQLNLLVHTTLTSSDNITTSELSCNLNN